MLGSPRQPEVEVVDDWRLIVEEEQGADIRPPYKSGLGEVV
jgi:hypothetical protein